MLVHEIAEELQLEHESVGEGVKRHIVLKKVNGNWEQKWKPGATDVWGYRGENLPKFGHFF